MRIGYFTNQYPAPSHTFIHREIVALEARGHTVERYAIRPATSGLHDPEDTAEAARTKYTLKAGPVGIAVSVLREAITNIRGFLSALSSAWRFAGASGRGLPIHLVYLAEATVLARWLRQDRVDHFHTHFGTNAATIACLAGTLSGVPFSVTVHGPEEFDRPDALDLRRKIAEAAFVVGVSSFGRSQLMRWSDPADWPKIAVVPCGIDRSYREGPPLTPVGEPRFLCVARLSEQKGHMVLVDAAARLRDQGANFHIVLAGDGPLRPNIEAAIAENGLADRFTLAGWVSQERVRNEIAASKAMVLPSFAEGLPVVLMESMALGRPAVTTYIAGIPELVDAQNGWLVPAGDAAGLAAALKEAIDADPAAMAARGDAGRVRVLDRHDIARSAELLERLFAGGKGLRTG